ncbi:MAG: hypothetical protein KGM98_06920, partial [Bacteroidota bacterium]|nr:hypothetical protein [Bacteroidota bacterium]
MGSINFGLLDTLPLDDQMYAQPLVVSNVSIGGGVHNVLYAATVNNTVYAYDADSGTAISPYWQINLTESGMRPPTNVDVNGSTYHDFTGKIGIVGTPVIDTSLGRLFVVARSVDASNNFYQYLHSIDIINGTDSKVLISAQISGSGAGSQSGVISFNPVMQNQRCALLLDNGIVYIVYASHADDNPYHGWILGYDENALTQKYVFMDTPNDSAGGIWMSGAGPAADNLGNLYVASGNGTGTASATNLQMSIFKLTPNTSSNTLDLSTFFTPYNYKSLDSFDYDFGPIQVLLIPNSNRALTGCKDGYIYLVDKDNMGGLGTSSNANLQALNVYNQMHSSFGYYHGTSGEYVYLWPEGEPLYAFPYNRTTNLLDNPETNSSLSGPTGQTGAFLSTSSDGSI